MTRPPPGNHREPASHNSDPAGHHIERRPVSSSVIRSAGYDPVTAVLQIEFAPGDVYEYFMVPSSAAKGFLQAESKGRYFAESVRHRFRFRKL